MRQAPGGSGGDSLDLRYDGKPVETSSDLPRMVGSTRPGQQASLEVWRKGQTRKLNVTVGELQEERVASRDTPKPYPRPGG